MTHSGGKPHAVGDRGQRYEVSVMDNDTKQRRVVGWAEEKSAADRMATSLALRPSWSQGQVRDRHDTTSYAVDEPKKP